MQTPTTMNQTAFAAIIETAHAVIEGDAKLSTAARTRWHNAVKTAGLELTANPFWFYESGTLVILSSTSDGLYEIGADGQHKDCTAYQQGFPCKHRAARKLVENYEKALKLTETVAPRSPRIVLNGVTPTDKAAPVYRRPSNGYGETVGGFQI